ncbi:bacteriocin [Lactococcus lactis]|uniref:Bacteriocin n=1 Tax=Lactococcus lactis TaxID=1358 RepID=A0AAP4DTL3_9LACT|nr:bacteriocin [Lactococcus lactis]MDG4968944.1 bacteriocin [Lactococcus lactis]MDG4975679.1 bacteriocin [Lactococcus lactis]MDG5103039.1 bacteriocin [Lactococcus lactis]
MRRNETIKLADGQEATIIRGDESALVNSYIVQLDSGELRVIDKKTLTLAPIQGRI